jgi:hypothetical protein
MDTKLRPIPFTIVDFLGILIPGLVWLVLLAEAFALCCTKQQLPTPLTSLKAIIDCCGIGDSWVRTVIIITMSLSVGSVFKAFSMSLAQRLAPVIWSSYENKLECRYIKFPYAEIYKTTETYQKAQAALSNILRFDPESLDRSKTFSVAKRFLRVVTPPLWDECEKREAEVRMTGNLLLAAVFSCLFKHPYTDLQ